MSYGTCSLAKKRQLPILNILEWAGCVKLIPLTRQWVVAARRQSQPSLDWSSRNSRQDRPAARLAKHALFY